MTLLTLGFAALSWIEHYLVHGPGDVQGQCIELDDEFAAFILKAYQLDDAGARKIRRAFLSRAKGRNKSGLAAMLACFEALGPCRFDHFAETGETSAWGYEYEAGEPVGQPLTYVEILNVATEEGQAGNTYDAIYYMLNPDTCSPYLLKDYGRIDVGLTRTNLPDRRGFIEPVTSADTSKDGGKSTFIVADETHLWTLPRLKRLHGVMTRNLLKRKAASGWMLETSTMYADGEGSVAEGTHSYARQVSRGRRRDSTLLFDHRQAADTWDLADRSQRLKALREAYGPASAWMNLDAIADSWDDPQVSEAEFRRYWCNQPVSLIEAPESESLVDPARWSAGVSTAPMGKVAAFAVEVSMDRMAASIAACGQVDPERFAVELLPWCRDVSRPQPSGVGWLLARCVELDKSHGPAVWGVDAGGPAGSLITPMQQAGLIVRLLGPVEVKSATARFVDAVNDGSLLHGPQPELDTAVREAVTRPIGDGGRAVSRKKSTVPVQGLIAATFAHLLARDRRTPEAYSIRELMEQIRQERAEEAANAKEPAGA